MRSVGLNQIQNKSNFDCNGLAMLLKLSDLKCIFAVDMNEIRNINQLSHRMAPHG